MDERKKKLIISEKCTIREAMDALNEVPLGIVMLVDANQKLVGVVTDGDIRRALVGEFSVGSPISEIMVKEPVVIKDGYNKNQALGMFSWKIKQIPVLDREKRVIDLLLYSEFCDILKDEKRVIVRGRAPLRISFAGGGTDVSPYIEDKGGVVLSSTINKYCFGTLIKRSDEKIIIYSSDYRMDVEIEGLSSINYDGKLDLIKAVIKLMHPSFGMDLYLQSDVPPGSGLGGSAAVASVVAGLLNHLRNNKFDEYQLSEIAFQAERVELGIAGGWQDQYAAVFGGFNFMEFKEDDVIVHPLRIKEEILNELESNLLICFTGKTRNSGHIVKSQIASYILKDKIVVDALIRTGNFAVQMKNILLKGDLKKFGQYLHESWLVKKQLNGKVSNSHIEKLYAAGIEAGAMGGKVLGAGAGGYILFFCSHLKRKIVRQALEANGGVIMDFGFDFRGLQTWTVRNNDEG